jgi:phthiocerol/phenolphthiocerol synthesis type-I polyketide synthase E
MEKENTLNEPNDFDIAVIGMAGRFPGAKNIDELWGALCSGRELVSFFSDEELRESGIDSSIYSDPYYVRAAAILDNPEMFDAQFFKYSPREAQMMDPQQRLLLECAWEAVENAGYDTERYQGSIGIYAGASLSTYALNNELIDSFAAKDLATIMGNDSNFLTTRVSYKLNLKGPSVTVQTACSTSLVAIHMACQSLLNQECDMALAGGACIRFPQKAGYIYQQGAIPSSDGHCRAFDEKADGTVFGSGAGVVVLKRLADAVKDGDNIHAVIKGSALNNDGHLKVDYTAPSVEGQSEVIVEALANAGVAADSITFIEAHGTGTSLGDPIEVAALTKAFRNYTDRKGYCVIGSLKTNIGHLDTAAGVASFIKAVMALKHKTIPPTLHFQKANPEIDFENSPFYVNNQLMDWEAPKPRRAGVSSLGIGGTNAHVILEEAPAAKGSGKSRPGQLLLLSTKTDTALETATKNLVEHLKSHRDINLADVAYTLQTGRQAFNHRRMLVCQDNEDAIKTLSEPDNKRVISTTSDATQREVVFVFSGQGSQYVNMGLDLYRNEPVFREEMDRCFEIWRSRLNIELGDIIYPGGPVTEEASEKITQTRYTQPALFTIEYALAKLWMSWGIKPAAMVGHSIGEYTAACLAGVFSLEDAIKLVGARSQLMQEMPDGLMLAVFLSENELRPILNEELAISVINLPSLCVVSGEKEAVADLRNQLSSKNIICRNVRTSHAFHSRMMDPVINAFAEQVKQVRLNKPQIPFVSNTSGTWITPDEATNPEYWARHLRQTVRFSDGAGELLKETNRAFLEVGPGNTFISLVRQHPAITNEHVVLASTPHPKDKTSDEAYILNTIGQLWLANVQVDWAGFHANEERHRLPLPAYPFERQRYWLGYRRKKRGAVATEAASLKGTSEVIQAIEEPGTVAREDQGEDIEKTLTTIWQDILGVKHVKNTDDFFELGGTSLIAVGLFTRIERIFKKKLSISTLFKAHTIEKLAEIIRSNEDIISRKCLVEMQPGNTRPPIFLIHAGGGNLFIYHSLVHYLGPEQLIYGLKSQGIDDGLPFLTSIEEIASKYIKEIKTIKPEGPYILAGFCMGGMLALEMALQLQEKGQGEARVIMMETYNWANIPDRSFFPNIMHIADRISLVFQKFLSGEEQFFQHRFELIGEKIAVKIEMFKSKLGTDFHKGTGRYLLLSELEKTNNAAADEYKPKSILKGKIFQIMPEKDFKIYSNPESGWDNAATEGVEIHKIPVFRRQMLFERHAALVAEKIKTCIKDVS